MCNLISVYLSLEPFSPLRGYVHMAVPARMVRDPFRCRSIKFVQLAGGRTQIVHVPGAVGACARAGNEGRKRRTIGNENITSKPLRTGQGWRVARGASMRSECCLGLYVSILLSLQTLVRSGRRSLAASLATAGWRVIWASLECVELWLVGKVSDYIFHKTQAFLLATLASRVTRRTINPYFSYCMVKLNKG